MTEITELRNFISNLHTLNDEEWNEMLQGWQTVNYRRKTILTAAGETERYLYFVLDGIQRAFYLGENDRESTIVFTYPPSFSGVADSFLTQMPSSYYFETLTASRMMRLPYERLEKLMRDFPNIQHMILKTTAHALRGVLIRQAEIQSFSAEEKFRTLMKRSPHLLQLVPHKYIASYMGMDATNFSKFLGSIKI